MNPSVIVDKCFLQGASATRIADLARTNRLVISDALFYELLTTDRDTRVRCFRKLATVRESVALVSHVGALMRVELETHRCSGKPSCHFDEDLAFDPNRFAQPSYRPSRREVKAARKQAVEIQHDVESLVARANSLGSVYPDLLGGPQQAEDQRIKEAVAEIVKPGALLDLYESLKPPAGELPLPPRSQIDENWALYRWLQLHLLFAFDLFVRHRGRVPSNRAASAQKKLVNDVLDAQVLALGCLEGAFATREKKLKMWWQQLNPGGVLHDG